MNPATDWIDQARRVLDALRSGAAETAGDATEGHSSDCRWCPVCQVAAVVRGERPEVTAALADVLTAAATALRTVAAEGEHHVPTAKAERGPQESQPPAPVQRIDIA